MTDPVVLSPALDTGGFAGVVAPPAVKAEILNRLISGARFAPTLGRDDVNRPRIAYPVAAPDEADWLSELEQFQVGTMNDDAVIVDLRKLGKLYDFSNEMVNDASISLTDVLANLLRDSLSATLDAGLLYGEDPKQPSGAVPNAPVVQADDLIAGVATARGQIADSGGVPSHVGLSGAALAAADTMRDANGQLVFGGGGFAQALSLTPVVIPQLGNDVIVYDAERIRLIVNGGDSEVIWSDQFRFDYDARTVRVKARVALAIPIVERAIRRIELGDGEGRRAEKSAPAKAAPAKTTR